MKLTLVMIALAFTALECFLRGFDAGKVAYECHYPHPFKGD